MKLIVRPVRMSDITTSIRKYATAYCEYPLRILAYSPSILVCILRILAYLPRIGEYSFAYSRVFSCVLAYSPRFPRVSAYGYGYMSPTRIRAFLVYVHVRVRRSSTRPKSFQASLTRPASAPLPAEAKQDGLPRLGL